jgi:hypothetical protein
MPDSPLPALLKGAAKPVPVVSKASFTAVVCRPFSRSPRRALAPFLLPPPSPPFVRRINAKTPTARNARARTPPAAPPAVAALRLGSFCSTVVEVNVTVVLVADWLVVDVTVVPVLDVVVVNDVRVAVVVVRHTKVSLI